MTTPINTFQDILDAIERDPALREELRRHILGDEMLQLPAQFRVFMEAVADMRETLKEGQQTLTGAVSELKTDVADLKEGQQTLKEGQQTLRDDVSELRTAVARIGRDVSRLAGTDFEAYASRLARRRIFRAMGISGAQIFSTARNPEPLHALADEALEAGALDERRANDLALADIVLTANQPDGTAIYILGEISITAREDDVQKATRRAEVLSTATGVPCLPVVLTQRLADGVTTDQVTLLIIEPEQQPSTGS